MLDVAVLETASAQLTFDLLSSSLTRPFCWLWVVMFLLLEPERDLDWDRDFDLVWDLDLESSRDLDLDLDLCPGSFPLEESLGKELERLRMSSSLRFDGPRLSFSLPCRFSELNLVDCCPSSCRWLRSSCCWRSH